MIQFAHIGLHKTATSWLQILLSQHPDLNLISTITCGPDHPLHEKGLMLGELAYRFDNEFNLDNWCSAFNEGLPDYAGISEEGLSGHMITGYGADGLAERLLTAFGQIKIMLVLRHPYSYVRSMYGQYIKQGGALPLHSLLREPTIPGKAIRNKLNYAAFIDIYRRHFDNVLILPYELLSDDQEAFLTYIWNFLDVEPIHDVEVQRANPGLTPISLSLMRRANFAGLDRRRVRTVLQTMDRRLFRKLQPDKAPDVSFALLNSYKGGRIFPGYDDLLREENYRIWDGALAKYNYTFEDRK